MFLLDKKLISRALILIMLFTNSGVSVFADSISNVVKNNISMTIEEQNKVEVNLVFNKDFNADGKIVVTLDPGHGGDEQGTLRRKYFFDDKDLIREKDINLYLATKIYEFLKSNSNIDVYMTRYDDTKITLAERGAIAGNNKSDLMVSVHFNAAPQLNNSSRAMGTEIWQSVINMYKPIGLSDYIFKELNKNHFLQVVRGAKERISADTYWNYELNDSQKENNGNPADYYGVIKAGCRNRVPTIILEHSFITNDSDFENILNPYYLDELAERVGKGIMNFYGS